MSLNESASRLPLSGVRVVDLSTSYAGPTATMYLADMGADVIKVERPGRGDDCRAWGPPFVDGWSAWYASANRNKRSVCLDLRDEGGREGFDRLLETSDVLVQSLNPTKLERLGLEPERVRSRYPDLIYCCLSGFGLTGTDRDLPGYDLIAQARSGLMSVTGEAGGSPQRVSTALSDIATGITAAFAIASALAGVRAGQGGRLIDLSLLDVDLGLMAPRIAAYLAGEPEPRPSGATDSVLAIYQTFPARDRTFVLAVGNDRMWTRLCEAVGLPEFARDPRFADNAGRREHRAMLVEELSAIFRGEEAQHWVDLLTDIGVPASLVHGLSEVVNDRHVIARESIVELDDEAAPSDESRTFRVVTHPWRLDGTSRSPTGPAALGTHTAEVLAEVGLDSHLIASLSQEEVMWSSHRRT